jgi:predicted DNA-binding protein with PD1-like motif
MQHIEKKEGEKMAHTSHSVYDEQRGILIGTLAKGTDLLDGIAAECDKHGLSAGAVTCIGSLSKAVFVQPSIQNGKPAYSRPVEWNSLVEVLSATGILSKAECGRLHLHMHALVVKEGGVISGGHLLQGENPVAVTIEFSVQAVRAGAIRAYDEQEGFRLLTLKPYKGE